MKTQLSLVLFFFSYLVVAQVQLAQDNFEGTSTISTWFGDDCGMDNNFSNPFSGGINTSSKVLKYTDVGGQYANVRFDAGFNFNMTNSAVFTLKIYVPSSGITGTQPNQISLKLQNGSLALPWTTQSEIIKPVVLNQWQTITFNFATDAFVNIDPTSVNPVYRTDFNRVVLQVNGENNTSRVVAYLDDFYYTSTASTTSNLIWSDEFDGTGAVNNLKWHHQTQLPNGNSWYNGEVQHYTNRPVNSSQANGLLTITAKKEVYSNNQGQTKQYTSARLNSKFAFKYGRVEVRAKLATGVGTWPAIWMLGKNIIEPGAYWSSSFGNVSWPACGEIDIMEHWGNNQNYVQSAMHTPSSFGNTSNFGGQTIANASTQFHTYVMEWNANSISFSVDNVVHYVYNPAVKNASTWPFNAEQYLLLNIAIEPSISANFVQTTMEIDYVRVYQQGALSTATIADKSNFRVYPNPVSEVLNIANEINCPVTKGNIYSITGQLLNSFSINENETTVNVGGLAPGIYFLEIQSDRGTERQKFIKK